MSAGRRHARWWGAARRRRAAACPRATDFRIHVPKSDACLLWAAGDSIDRRFVFRAKRVIVAVYFVVILTQIAGRRQALVVGFCIFLDNSVIPASYHRCGQRPNNKSDQSASDYPTINLHM